MTEEVLVRSFIRNDKVLEQPNVTIAGAGHGRLHRPHPSGRSSCTNSSASRRTPRTPARGTTRPRPWLETVPRERVDGPRRCPLAKASQTLFNPSPSLPSSLPRSLEMSIWNPSPEPSVKTCLTLLSLLPTPPQSPHVLRFSSCSHQRARLRAHRRSQPGHHPDAMMSLICDRAPGPESEVLCDGAWMASARTPPSRVVVSLCRGCREGGRSFICRRCWDEVVRPLDGLFSRHATDPVEPRFIRLG